MGFKSTIESYVMEKRPTQRAPDGAAPQDFAAQFAKFGAIMFRSLAHPPRR